MGIFINNSHPASYRASRQYFYHRGWIPILQIFTYAFPFPILTSLICHSERHGHMPKHLQDQGLEQAKTERQKLKP